MSLEWTDSRVEKDIKEELETVEKIVTMLSMADRKKSTRILEYVDSFLEGKEKNTSSPWLKAGDLDVEDFKKHILAEMEKRREHESEADAE